jgi:hypothetical protein
VVFFLYIAYSFTIREVAVYILMQAFLVQRSGSLCWVTSFNAEERNDHATVGKRPHPRGFSSHTPIVLIFDFSSVFLDLESSIVFNECA